MPRPALRAAQIDCFESPCQKLAEPPCLSQPLSLSLSSYFSPSAAAGLPPQRSTTPLPHSHGRMHIGRVAIGGVLCSSSGSAGQALGASLAHAGPALTERPRLRFDDNKSVPAWPNACIPARSAHMYTKTSVFPPNSTSLPSSAFDSPRTRPAPSTGSTTITTTSPPSISAAAGLARTGACRTILPAA